LKKNIEDNIAYKTSFNRIRKKRPALDIMFSPNELGEVTDLLKLGDRAGIDVLSTSGTGASNAMKDVISTIADQAANETVLETLKQAARNRTEKQAVEALTKQVKELQTSLAKQSGKELAEQQAKALIKETVEKLPLNQWGPRRKGIKALQTFGQFEEGRERN